MKQLVRKTNGIDQHDLENADTLKSFVKKQIYMKGFNFNVVVGDNPTNDIKLGGKARFLYGINLLITAARVADEDLFSLTINEEVICDKVNWKNFYPGLNSGKLQMYFPIPRPLSGSDSVNIGWTATGANKTVYPSFFLSEIDQSKK